MKLKMSDDFWVKERNTKLDEERVRIGIELENVKTTRQLFVEDFPSRKENENNSKTKLELEELRNRKLNKSSNVLKVRQELTGSVEVTKTETDPSSLQDVKITVPFSDSLEDPVENSKNQFAGNVHNDPADTRGRNRELKYTKEKGKTAVRSKSLSSIKNAGNKLKSLANEKMKNVMKKYKHH